MVLLLAFAAGLRAFSARALAAVALTVVGVMVASYGELFLHPLGIAFQVRPDCLRMAPTFGH